MDPQRYVLLLLLLTTFAALVYINMFSTKSETDINSKVNLLAYQAVLLAREIFKSKLIHSTPIANLNGSLEDPNVSFNPVFNSTLHIYTVDNKPILFLYWNNNQMPPHIQLSLETIKCHAHNNVHIVLGYPEFALSQLNESKDQFPWLIPAHQADYYRCSMILKYGGMYMDIDTIQLNSVRYLFVYLMEFDVFGGDWKPEGAPIAMGNIGPMRAGNLLLTKWKTRADKILTNKYEQLKNFSIWSGDNPIWWSELLGGILVPTMTDLLANKQINYTFIDGAATYGQIFEPPIKHLLFQRMEKSNANKAKQLNFTVDFLYYANSGLGHLAKLSMEEFLSKQFLFTEIIRKAISQCKAWQNGLYDSDLIRKLNISTFNNFSL